MNFKSGISNNFWLSIISLFVISLNLLGVKVNPDDLNSVVSAIDSKQLTAIIVAVVGAVMGLYNAFKANKLTGKITDVFKHRNWWTALIMAISGAFSSFQFGDFPVDQAEALTDAVFTGNFTLIITALWTFGQTIYFIFFKKKEDPETTLVSSS